MNQGVETEKSNSHVFTFVHGDGTVEEYYVVSVWRLPGESKPRMVAFDLPKSNLRVFFCMLHRRAGIPRKIPWARTCIDSQSDINPDHKLTDNGYAALVRHAGAILNGVSANNND